MLNPIRRVIAPVNPFACQQVPTIDSVGLQDRYGNAFWSPFNYLSDNVYKKWFPNHYDALKDEDVTRTHQDKVHGYVAGPGIKGHIEGKDDELYPRACYRAFKAYTTCKMVNGKEKCGEEMQNTVEICPTWCLEKMADRKRFDRKVL